MRGLVLDDPGLDAGEPVLDADHPPLGEARRQPHESDRRHDRRHREPCEPPRPWVGLRMDHRACGLDRTDDLQAFGRRDRHDQRSSTSAPITAERSTAPITRSPSITRSGRSDDGERRDELLDEGVGRHLPGVVETLAGTDGTGDRAGRQHVGAGHVLREVGHVVVGGSSDDLLGRADLHEPAVLHDRDAVAELQGLGEVVGDEDHRLAQVLLQRDHLILHVPADQRVERAERLVEQQDLRVVRERASQPDPLLHAAGELVGVGGVPSVQPDAAEHLVRRRQPFLPSLTLHLEPEGHVLGDRAVREQTEVLEDHADLATTHLA